MYREIPLLLRDIAELRGLEILKDREDRISLRSAGVDVFGSR